MTEHPRPDFNPQYYSRGIFLDMEQIHTEIPAETTDASVHEGADIKIGPPPPANEGNQRRSQQTSKQLSRFQDYTPHEQIVF